SGMFSNHSSPFAKPIGGQVPRVSINGVPSIPAAAPAPAQNVYASATRPPYHQQNQQPASQEFLQQVEEAKANGLNMSIEGIPSENAKSRVETQIKITLRLTNDNGERVTCWSHLGLPEMLVSRDKFRHRLHRHPAAEGSLPASPEHAVHLDASVICSSDPTRKVETCISCIRREYKRSLRRKDARLRSAVQSACTTPAQSRPGSPDGGAAAGRAMTGTMESDWDEARIAVEKQRIVIFNCNDMLDFSKGEVVLPTRITCYCRHHSEKVGFFLCFKLVDSTGTVLQTLMSPPVMITDDHKSTKFKTERKTRPKAEYERQLGEGNAAYANHALGGMGSPTSHHAHHHYHHGASQLAEMPGGHLGFKGGRQAMSARNSPTLRPYSHHALLDTYSQFASLAGTPSLGNTPIGSPLMSAAHISGFESPFHLPQAAAAGGGYQANAGPSLFSNLMGPPVSGHNAAAAAAAAMVANYSSQQSQSNLLPMSPMYGGMPGQQQHQQPQHGQHGMFGFQQQSLGGDTVLASNEPIRVT
ncbi:SPT3 Dosage dependent suppressor of Ty-induced promoter mutations-like protein, partial [Coemansia sp. RSA 2603]